MVWENFGTLIMNIGLMGGGIASGVIALILGITRGSHSASKNPGVQDTYPLVFTVFTWMIAMIVPNTALGVTLFLMGAISLTFAYNNVFTGFSNSNIWYIAIIVILVDITLVATIEIWNSPYQNNLDSARLIIAEKYDTKVKAAIAILPDLGACDDYPQITGEACDSKVFRGIFNSIVQFQPIENILNVGAYAAIAIESAIAAVKAPFMIMSHISGLVTNSVSAILIGIYAMLWHLVLVFNIIRLMLAGRGITQ